MAPRGFMRRFAILVLLLVPAPANARVDSCFECVLGIFDDISLTSCSGTLPPGTPTDLFVGIRFDPAGRFNALSGFEISIAGLGGDLLLGGFDVPPPCVWTLGSAPAPADTSATSTGTGGMTLSYCSCMSGSQALLKLTLIAFRPLTDRVLQVKRKYPPSSPEWNTPVLFQCDAPNYTPVRVTGGCYVINPSGTTPPACASSCPPLSMEPATWTAIKTLFRD
jgi:hypothetical protein